MREYSHIDEFRTREFRVFLAGPYFNLDLNKEIRWQKRHIEKLKKHDPHTYHRQFTSEDIDERRMRHFKEHVIDSIPFHEKILKDHEKRLETILSIMPKRTYFRIAKISREKGGTPEYFVYNKKHKHYFFVVEHVDEARSRWISLVRDQMKLAGVIILRR